MRVSLRSASAYAVLILVSSVSLAARRAADPPVVEEQLVVREVGVVADLPTSLRERSAAELERRLVVLEGGVERRPTSVVALGGDDARPYGRVLVLFDLLRCSQQVLAAGAAALGSEAEQLTALGATEVATLGERLEIREAATGSSSELAAALGRVGREVRCAAPPSTERLRDLALGVDELSCPGAPCLLVWVGPGWGEVPGEGGAEQPADPKQVEPLARTLASHRWVVLAAPIGAVAEPESRRSIPEPETQPGSDRHTFGIDVLAWKRNQPRSQEEYGRFVDLWLAPLRQLVRATAGEFVTRADGVAVALRSLGDRSMLYYRTDRRPDGEPPELAVRARRGAENAYRTAAWAPAN